MSLVQGVEKLGDIHIQDPLGPFRHALVPQGAERPMGRPLRSEAVRTVQKVLLIDRFQDHGHRALQQFIFRGRNSNWPGFVARPFRNVYATDRRRKVGSGFGPIE